MKFPELPAHSDIGYVYLSRGQREGLFKIGKTTDLSRRIDSHRTTDCGFEYALHFRTEEHSASETYLKKFFADQREPGTSEFFAISIEEFAQAIPMALRYSQSVAQHRDEILRLQRKQSSEKSLRPTASMADRVQRLRELEGQMNRLRLEADLLIMDLAIQIGDYRGIDEMVEWKTSTRMQLVDSSGLADLLRLRMPELYSRHWQRRSIRRWCLL